MELEVPTITIDRLRNADRQSMGIGNRAAWNLPKIRDRLQQEGLFPSLHTTYEMRQRAVEYLLEYGYRPSPCGWWSRPGTYPDGNIPRVSRNKWQRFDTMLAFGPGAYGWLTGQTGPSCRPTTSRTSTSTSSTSRPPHAQRGDAARGDHLGVPARPHRLVRRRGVQQGVAA